MNVMDVMDMMDIADQHPAHFPNFVILVRMTDTVFPPINTWLHLRWNDISDENVLANIRGLQNVRTYVSSSRNNSVLFFFTTQKKVSIIYTGTTGST